MGGIYPFGSRTRRPAVTWNPYLFAGVPHLADTQTIVLYPPAFLLRWLPVAPFLSWMIALHLWIAGAGTLFLARVIGLGWVSASAAMLAVTFGGSVAPWLHHGHLLLLFSTSWLPWALGLSVLSARRATLAPHPALVLVLVLQFLAGFAQSSLYIAAVVGFYFVYAAAWPDKASDDVARWRPLAQVAVLAVVTLLVSAFQLLPFIELVAEAGRTAGIPYSAAAEDGWSFRDLASVFFPFYGIQGSRTYRNMPDPAYVSVVLVCLVPFAFLCRSRRRMAIFCSLLVVGAMAFALGDHLPFYRLHHFLFPGLRVPGRLLFIATLGLALLGGLGLERFVALAADRPRQSVAAIAVLTLIAFGAAGLALLSRGSTPVPPAHAWPWLFVAAMALVIGLSPIAAALGRRPALVAALVVVAVDLTVYAKGAVETVPVESAQTLRMWLGTPDGGRAWSACNHRVGAAELSIHGQAALRGLGGVYLRDYAEWFALLETADRPSDTIGKTGIRRDLLNSANVTSIIACEPLDVASLTSISHVGPVRVYENTAAWPRAVWMCEGQELSRDPIVAMLRRGRYESGRLVVVDGSIVHVRWAPTMSDDQRRERERHYQLFEGVQTEGATWRYVLGDGSPANVGALTRDGAVEDTNGIDRGAGILVPSSEADARDSRFTQLLIRAGECERAAEVNLVTVDRPDGHLKLRVNAPAHGFVFLSEPYYPERQAFVDGQPVAAVKANVAFTAVPVAPGWHDVELRYVPRSFYQGITISLATLIAWTLIGRRRRLRAGR